MNSINRQGFDPDKSAVNEAWPLFHRVLPADPLAIREALSEVRIRFARSVAPEAIGRIELILAEVMNNIAEHAGPKPENTSDDAVPTIHLSIVRSMRGFVCTVADDGIMIPDECLHQRYLPMPDASAPSENGFGWFLIQSLAQTLCYYREDQMNYLAFNVPLTQ